MKRISAMVFAAVLGVGTVLPSGDAAVVYWDPWGPGSFGGINGSVTWTAPLDLVWTFSNTGGSRRLGSYTTTFNDDCNFGGPTAGIGGGTVPVATVNAGTISFNTITGSGTVVLDGGTITLKTDSRITVNNSADTITSVLAGAASSLTKAGSGTLNLSGSNTYTGTTVVAGGTLSISTPYLADVGAVSITNSATLNLDFTGSDTVHALYIDGEQTVSGIWGGPASPAPLKSESLNGFGTLTVKTGVEPPGGILLTIR